MGQETQQVLIEGKLVERRSDAGLKPLRGVSEKADRRNRHGADLRRKGNKIIKY
jgi:hypothetical protein